MGLPLQPLTETWICHARGAGTAANKDKHITVQEGDQYSNRTVGSAPADVCHLESPFALARKGEPAEGTVDKGKTEATKNVSINPVSTLTSDVSGMQPNGHKNMAIPLNGVDADSSSLAATATANGATPNARPPLVWDWPIEHEDRKKEKKADAAMHGSMPFEVDRRVLKDVVREKMGVEVGRITFLSAGTFHKAYLVTLVDHAELVARVARRFMPRVKTESEVATMNYLRQNTSVPVPTIYHYDSNPYNRLGGEFILMSKAPGIPLAKVYHGLGHNELLRLLKNLAAIVIPLFAHRFDAVGSLYSGPDPLRNVASGAPTPKAAQEHYSGFPFSPTLSAFPNNGLTPKASSAVIPTLKTIPREFHVGPIISWPFFGSNRGELTHPTELNRGPWSSTQSYVASCAEREIQGVVRENEGKSAPHKLHLDPDEIKASRYHALRSVPGDESDESDEWGLEESEDEWEGPGDAMYRDYRRMQRSTFLVAQLKEREDAVKKEMERWTSMMKRLSALVKKDEERKGSEEFALDCHDLSLENIFVDEVDSTKITCIIDWESTTTRPLWAAAHLPAFISSSPFVAKLFRQVISQLPSDPSVSIQLHPSGSRKYSAAKPTELSTLCQDWLYYESTGMRLRMAHRCAEWDGWEEGLVESIMGPEEYESEWFMEPTAANGCGGPKSVGSPVPNGFSSDLFTDDSFPSALPVTNGLSSTLKKAKSKMGVDSRAAANGVKLSSKLPMLSGEREKEQMLDMTGDFCGGRGGELGRRLEAWLTVSGGALTGRGHDWDVDVFDR